MTMEFRFRRGKGKGKGRAPWGRVLFAMGEIAAMSGSRRGLGEEEEAYGRVMAQALLTFWDRQYMLV